MAVYVDSAKIPYRRMIMCHMIADSLAELHLMAEKIGVAKRHFQDKPTHPHYDICMSKRKEAVKLGAFEVSQRDVVHILKKQYGNQRR